MSDLPGTPNPTESREPVRFLVFSASLRSASPNTKLAELAATVIERHGIVDMAGMADFGGIYKRPWGVVSGKPGDPCLRVEGRLSNRG